MVYTAQSIGFASAATIQIGHAIVVGTLPVVVFDSLADVSNRWLMAQRTCEVADHDHHHHLDGLVDHATTDQAVFLVAISGKIHRRQNEKIFATK